MRTWNPKPSQPRSVQDAPEILRTVPAPNFSAAALPTRPRLTLRNPPEPPHVASSQTLCVLLADLATVARQPMTASVQSSKFEVQGSKFRPSQLSLPVRSKSVLPASPQRRLPVNNH